MLELPAVAHRGRSVEIERGSSVGVKGKLSSHACLPPLLSCLGLTCYPVYFLHGLASAFTCEGIHAFFFVSRALVSLSLSVTGKKRREG